MIWSHVLLTQESLAVANWIQTLHHLQVMIILLSHYICVFYVF